MQSMGKPSDSYHRGWLPRHLLKRNKAKQDKTANQLTQLMEDFFYTADD
jgi:hypothetical protein